MNSTKTETKTLALRAVALAGLLSALPMSGQAWGGGRGHGGAGPDMMGMGSPPVMRMIRKLDLADPQREQVFAILDRYRPTLRKLMFSQGDRRKALNAILVGDGYDAARIEQDAAAQGQAAQELYATTARMLSEIGAVLTPEQRARLNRRHGPVGPVASR